jgi:hypothetical protein
MVVQELKLCTTKREIMDTGKKRGLHYYNSSLAHQTEYPDLQKKSISKKDCFYHIFFNNIDYCVASVLCGLFSYPFLDASSWIARLMSSGIAVENE